MTAAALLEEAGRLQRGGALAQAAERYRELLLAQPQSPEALLGLAQIACMQGHIADGMELARGALTLDPQRAAAHELLGQALARLGRPAEALSSLDAAIAFDPAQPSSHGLRGDVLLDLGRPEDAVAAYDRALALRPDSVETWCNRGAALHDLRRYRDAIASFDRVLALRPEFIEVHLNRAGALARLGLFADAIDGYNQTLAIHPDHAEALASRAAILVRLKRYPEAIADAAHALAIDPTHPRALGELATAALAICDWSRSEGLERALSDRLAQGTLAISPFSLLGISDDPKLLHDCARRYVEREIPWVAPLPPRPAGRRADGRIRLAYASADLREHATAYLMARLFELHDRDRFEVIGLSFRRDDGSPMRARLQRAFDRFIDVSAQSDREVALLMRELEVDIAVDLMGHTDGARPDIFAHRPAPVQVAYLGYPGTSGADFLDYVIADATVLPRSLQDAFSERIVHLPDSYQANDPMREISAMAASRQALGLPEDAFVFCCFNQAWKINRAMFDVWMRLLKAHDGSVLWLLHTNDEATSNLRRAAQARGIAPDRLVFAGFTALPQHLARLQHADLFLDTLPCNAHTTASDALWAGVPVLTCTGNTFAGRVGASLLRAIGLPELVTDSMATYEACAHMLAADPVRLQALRRKLAENRTTQPLFDTDRFRRHLEAAYLRMWDIHRSGEPPRGFSVAPDNG